MGKYSLLSITRRSQFHRDLGVLWLSLCVVVATMVFHRGSVTHAAEGIKELFSVPLAGTHFLHVSPSGRYVLLSKPFQQDVPEGTEYGPGGEFSLYSEKGRLLWSRKFEDQLFFASHERYLLQPSEMQSSVVRLESGEVLFRLPASYKDTYSLDINGAGDKILVGDHDGHVSLLQNLEAVWSYESERKSSAGVAFGGDGAWFVEDLTDNVFRIDQSSRVTKFAVAVEEQAPRVVPNKSSGIVHFVFPRGDKLFTLNPKERRLVKWDFTSLEEKNEQCLKRVLKKKAVSEPQQIAWSLRRDYVGLIVGGTFRYFRVRCS